ncbi:hypothetical protein [Sporosarcina sp. FSL W7-1283]|uniref:hypothetical protein n=1 Tax=Sporosarcina sp. FSL W7-1283 TaxID=2921560 RepID=UPI0030FBAE31
MVEKSSVDCVTPTNFGLLFLNGDSELIYKQCIKDFQRLTTADQFEELITSFNENVTSYSVKFTAQFGPLTHYIWVDAAERKAISVYFDEENQIHRLLIKPYAKYLKPMQFIRSKLIRCRLKKSGRSFGEAPMNS